MGFPARATAPTAHRLLRVAVTWVTARASALSAFLGAAHSRLLELLTDLPKDGSALRELEERMHREIGRCSTSLLQQFCVLHTLAQRFCPKWSCCSWPIHIYACRTARKSRLRFSSAAAVIE